MSVPQLRTIFTLNGKAGLSINSFSVQSFKILTVTDSYYFPFAYTCVLSRFSRV